MRVELDAIGLPTLSELIEDETCDAMGIENPMEDAFGSYSDFGDSD